jgi:hypothetical protein
LAEVEKPTLALAGERCGVVESGDVFLPRFPGLIRLAGALFIFNFPDERSFLNMDEI